MEEFICLTFIRYTLWKGTKLKQNKIIRYTQEKTFSLIDEKLKVVREKIPNVQEMDMKEFHLIFTQSNELIHVVDCRSQEEFDTCHISGAHRLVCSLLCL